MDYQLIDLINQDKVQDLMDSFGSLGIRGVAPIYTGQANI
jgi:hypothetical protein